jgi:catechol 2,3-dioxygenase-like lactoylglutathione lyase family enzyme
MVSTALGAAVLCCVAAGAQGQGAAGPVVGTCNFSPVVSNLDRAIDFYSKAIGLQVGMVNTITDANRSLLDIHGTPKASMRWAAARMPGGTCGVELVEFGGSDRTPVQPRPYDVGATTLVLQVRDMASAVARAKQAGAQIVSAGGNVISFPNGHGGAVLFKDPDGHYVEFLQLPAQSGTPAPQGADNIITWRPRIVVNDGDKAVALYRELGFQVPSVEFGKNKVFTDLNAIGDVAFRIHNADVPAGTRLEIVDFQGLPHATVRPRVQDPGAARFQLRVTDVPKVAHLVTDAGGSIVSTSGRAYELPAGRGGTITAQAVRDPNGLYLVLTGQSAGGAR